LTARHPDGALGFADTVWWSRLAQPALRAWAEENHPLRLVEQPGAQDDPDPKALACYGLVLRQAARDEQLWRRFVAGRPVSAVTRPFLEWCCGKLEAHGVRVWVLIGDNASWQVRPAVRAWVRAHHRQVKRSGGGGVRLRVCCLPVKSPWLNPLEPKGVQGKRAIVEPTRLLSARAVAERVCAYFGCAHEDHRIQEKAS
jgi:hypothetical protein